MGAEFSMEINSKKNYIMPLRGMEQIRSKIFFHWQFHFCVDSLQIWKDNNTVTFSDNTNYLWYNIVHEGNKDLNVNYANFVKILGLINQIFKPLLIFMHARIWIYFTECLLVIYVIEMNHAWTVWTDDRNWYQQKCTTGYTLLESNNVPVPAILLEYVIRWVPSLVL